MTLVGIDPRNVNYDSDHDVLHVFFPPFDYSVDDEDFPDIIIKRSLANERVTGLVIINFSKQKNEYLKQVLPRYDFEEIRKIYLG